MKTPKLSELVPLLACETFVAPDIIILQRGSLEQTKWRDPDDTAAMERDPLTGRAHRRTVAGWRTIDPLTRLPCEEVHIRAAARLRADWEHGSGATGSGLVLERKDSAWDESKNSAAENQIQARRRYENAVQGVGMRGCAWLLPVVLGGLTVADVARRLRGNAMAGQGRVMSALDRLVDHYGIGGRIVSNVWEIVTVVDAGVTDVPQEQLGRAKK